MHPKKIQESGRILIIPRDVLPKREVPAGVPPTFPIERALSCSAAMVKRMFAEHIQNEKADLEARTESEMGEA